MNDLSDRSFAAPGSSIAGDDPIDRGIIITLATMLCICGSGQTYVLNEYLSGLRLLSGISLQQLGLIAGIESLCIAIACLITVPLVQRLGWYVIPACAAFCVSGDALSLYATGFASASVVRAITGLLGEGPLFTTGFAILGSARNPDRAFGIALTMTSLFAVVIFSVEVALQATFGPAGVFTPFILAAACLIVLATACRRQLSDQIERQRRSRRDLRLASSSPAARSIVARGLAAMLSVTVLSSVTFGYWAFTASAAITMGVATGQTGRAFAIANIVGLGGSILPALIGSRFGRLGPLALSCGGLIVSSAMFFHGHGGNIVFTASLLCFCWNLGGVYQFAGLATVGEGRYSAHGAIAQIAGAAIGPVIGGAVLNRFGFAGAPIAVVVGSAIAVLLFASALSWRAPAPVPTGRTTSSRESSAASAS